MAPTDMAQTDMAPPLIAFRIAAFCAAMSVGPFSLIMREFSLGATAQSPAIPIIL